MLNRHLFRGKRLDNGEWVQGNLVENWQFGNNFIPAVIRPRQIEFHQDYTQKSYALEVDPATVGQCTGLCDKNETIIFEGDIVKDERGNIGRIQYLPQECGYVVVLSRRDYRLGHRNRRSNYDSDMGLEVIGNTYDNPELLEVTP